MHVDMPPEEVRDSPEACLPCPRARVRGIARLSLLRMSREPGLNILRGEERLASSALRRLRKVAHSLAPVADSGARDAGKVGDVAGGEKPFMRRHVHAASMNALGSKSM